MAEDLVFMMGKLKPVSPATGFTRRIICGSNRSSRDIASGLPRIRFGYFKTFIFWIGISTRKPTFGKRKKLERLKVRRRFQSLYAPFDGRVVEFNEALLDDPSTINTDNYGVGWLFRFHTEAPLLSPAEYVAHLEQGWEETQRHLKGQIN